MIRNRLAVVLLAVTLVASAIAQQPFRLVFANTSLSTVLRAIGLHSGANIVYVGKEDPLVTLNVTAGSTEDALRFATTAAGVTYRRIGNTYVVAKHDDMRKAVEPFGLRYRIPLTKLNTSEATELLRNSLPYLTVQPAGTQILVTGTRDDIEQARELIREQEMLSTTERSTLDIVPVRVVSVQQVAGILGDMYPEVRFRTIPQGEVGGTIIMTGPAGRVAEAKTTLSLIDTKNPLPGSEIVYEIYEIRYSSAPTLMSFMTKAMPDLEVIAAPENYAPPAPGFRPLSGASVASTGSGANSGGGAGRANQNIAPGENNEPRPEKAKKLVVRGGRDRVNAAVKLLAELDVRPKQVMVEVKVVDYSPSKDSEVGFDWNWRSFNFYERPKGYGIQVEGDNPIAEPTDFVTRPVGLGIFSRMPWAFQSILRAAITRREARLLATPSVQVVDGEDANIFIGDTIRAQVSQTGALGSQTVEIVEFPIGIILLIRPRVNADGDITLRVHPVVSTVTGVDENNLPQTSTREAETTLVVKDGETMVLGGLIRDEMSKVVREVPFLSQLPLIGELFRSTTKNNRKSEILIFITPKIVDGAERAVLPEQKSQPAGPQQNAGKEGT